MPRRTEILEHLRAQGLNPIEVDSWRTRGSTTFGPRGSVNHHTAGPRVGNHPSLGVLINGRSDLPGPLCNVSIARNCDVYLIAAGRANHAGAGGWYDLQGNSSVWGLEVEHTGNLSTEPAPSPEMWDTMYRVHAAFATASGFHAGYVCQHFEWTSRKIDFVAAPVHQFRAGVAQQLAGTPTPNPPQEDDDMKRWIVRDSQTGAVYVFDGQRLDPANDARYRETMIFHGALVPAEGDGAGAWFNWAHADIENVLANQPEIDVDALAAAIAAKLPPGTVDTKAIATETAAELHRRLAS